MKTDTRMLVDVSSVVKTCLYAGVDEEFGRKVVFEGRTIQVNSAAYGLDNAINMITAKLKIAGLQPRDMILVVEGHNSKALRKSMWDGYKANRPDAAPDVNAQTNRARDLFVKTFLDLGAQAVTQSGVEADDVIAYLAEILPNSYIVSNDGDLQRCISPKCHVIDKDNQVDQNRYGPFSTEYTTVYKALVGDSNDNIKGAKGFGEKAWLHLLVTFGEKGLAMMEKLIISRNLERLAEDVAELPCLQTIVDDMEGVYRSYDLARLYPEKVNTLRRPLEWTVGMVKQKPEVADDRLSHWYGNRKVVHEGNFDISIAHLKKMVAVSPYVFTDIETTSPRESDEWLAEKTKKDPDSDDLGVDTLGHELTGLSLTYGPNAQYTIYFAVDHNETDGLRNVSPLQVLEAMKLIPPEKFNLVHSAAFELSVLERTWGEAWRANGWHGFLPNVLCTRIMATYVDENERTGLKELSGRLLKYNQVTYKEVTKGRKMNQMSATETLEYASDDTVCTAAIFNHFLVITEIEHTFDVFVSVEQRASYLHALGFNRGINLSREELRRQEENDQRDLDAAWATLHGYLIKKGWAGTVCPKADNETTTDPAFIKHAFNIVTGRELVTKRRKFDLVLAELKQQHEDHPDTELFCNLMTDAFMGRFEGINKLLELRFNGAPVFNIDSWVQVAKLLYHVMGLPVRLRNPLTDTQRAKNQEKGGPRTDDLAMQYAMQYDVKPGTEEYTALKAVQTMKIAHTRFKLYYKPYRYIFHWKDDLVHPNFGQAVAVTKRATCSGPNVQQWPKHPKATGVKPEFRAVCVPHHKRAVVVSKDFSSQEIVIQAEKSRDEALLSCFIGENKKNVHSLTAAGILKKKAVAGRVEQLWTMGGNTGDVTTTFRELVQTWRKADYEMFMSLQDDPKLKRLYETLRALGKKTNFTTDYGAMAPKLAETLLIEIDEALEYIEAKFAAMPGMNRWKEKVIEALHKLGYSVSLLGVRRHLRSALLSGKAYEIGSAERQGINHEIQGSAAEQTKLAMGAMWDLGVYFKYDARFYGPIHDEVVDSVGIDDLLPFLYESHKAMVQPYANMIVPINSSISFGHNFKDQHEMGEAVDPAAIRAKLAELFPNEAADARWRKPYAFEMEAVKMAA